MNDRFGVAVFGCGGVSAGHFSAYAANPQARLVAAVDTRPELAEAAVEGGATIVELGIPFADPLAEGPAIRLASERAV